MFLNIFLDVILITIVVGGSRYGYNRGLFKMAATPVGVILCLILSFTYSSIVGVNILSPIILAVASDNLLPFIILIINPLSTVVAFALLFFAVKILVSFLISLVNQIFDKGIIGKINKAFGGAFSGVVAFLIATCVASFSEYILMQEVFYDSKFLDGFFGGPIYRAFLSISPLRLLFDN